MSVPCRHILGGLSGPLKRVGRAPQSWHVELILRNWELPYHISAAKRIRISLLGHGQSSYRDICLFLGCLVRGHLMSIPCSPSDLGGNARSLQDLGTIRRYGQVPHFVPAIGLDVCPRRLPCRIISASPSYTTWFQMMMASCVRSAASSSNMTC